MAERALDGWLLMVGKMLLQQQHAICNRLCLFCYANFCVALLEMHLAHRLGKINKNCKEKTEETKNKNGFKKLCKFLAFVHCFSKYLLILQKTLRFHSTKVSADC